MGKSQVDSERTLRGASVKKGFARAWTDVLEGFFCMGKSQVDSERTLSNRPKTTSPFLRTVTAKLSIIAAIMDSQCPLISADLIADSD